MKEFKELNLKPELLEALKHMNFVTMTEVQELSIPIALQHKDIIVRSKTGSGKTGAFLVPIFQLMEHKGYPQAIVIVPTRELALQVSGVAEPLARKCRIRTAIVYGGASINVQMHALSGGADLIIGTPGRILDLIERGALRLEKIKFLVLDEADLMLDMGFIEDVEEIISNSPRERQTILLSATMPREVHEIARRHMKTDVHKLTVGEEEDLTVNTITHSYFIADGKLKFSALLAYIDQFNPKKSIIFSSTQRESELIHRFLESNGFDVIVMHGGLTQSMRERSLRAFKEHARFLISTNLAARGLDIPDITDIINFDAPDDPRTYVHRVGRSARMGKNGRAFTIFGYEERDLMNATSRVANVKMNHIDLDTAKFKDVTLPAQSHRRSFRGNTNFGSRRDSHSQGGRRDYHSGSGNRGSSSRGTFHKGGGRSFNRNRHEYGRRDSSQN